MSIERNYEAMCEEYLRELIAIDTVNPPGNEEVCARKVAALLNKEGFVCRYQEVLPGRYNLITELPEWQQGKKDEPAVILTGHMDVVPAADGWDSDPFVLTERNEVFYGRGTCDMKGGLAAMMSAAVWAKDHQQQVPFRLAFVMDEELWGLGTLAAIKEGDLGNIRVAVIGEPTLNRIHIAHRGALRYHVTVKGRSGHAGKPWMSIDPIHVAAVVIRAVEEVNKDLQSRDTGVLPAATMCITEIASGLKDNVIPEICRLTIDTRPCLGDTAQSFETLIREKIDLLGGIPQGASLEFDPYMDGAAGYLEEDSDAVSYCRNVYEKVFGDEPVVEAFPACCDQVYFTSRGIPALLYGPGSIEQAHTTNEFVTKDELSRALRFYIGLISDEA